MSINGISLLTRVRDIKIRRSLTAQWRLAFFSQAPHDKWENSEFCRNCV